MQITGPEIGHLRLRRRIVQCLILFSAGGWLNAQTEAASWIPVISALAGSLSQGDAPGALRAFDSGMKNYGSIEGNLSALVAQADILCAIDVLEDKEEAGLRTLDVDWYMQLVSHADGGPTERRRQRVELHLRQIRGKWKIVGLTPLSITEPIHIP